MSRSQARIYGTLKADGTLELDENPNLPPGRVQVILSAAPAEAGAKESVWTVLDKIWAERTALGIHGRTREEIDAGVKALRDEWEEHMLSLERIHDEGRRGREKPGC
jgi:hypothetical protein